MARASGKLVTALAKVLAAGTLEIAKEARLPPPVVGNAQAGRAGGKGGRGPAPGAAAGFGGGGAAAAPHGAARDDEPPARLAPPSRQDLELIGLADSAWSSDDE